MASSPGAPTQREGRLRDKVAIVTGGGSGIGKAVALAYVNEGARVLIVGRTEETGEATATEARSLATAGGEAAFLRADVTRAEDVEAAVQYCRDRWGQLDAMFNGAGVSGSRFGDGPVADCSLDGWHTIIESNLTSMFHCCKYGVAAMADHGGSIVNLSSILGLVGGDEHFRSHAYAASKGGIVALTRAIASYYAPQRIRANVLAPALIRTAMSQRAQDDPAILDRLSDLQPLTGAFGEPGDVAGAAVYLASDESSFVTGVVLPIDGGWTVR